LGPGGKREGGNGSKMSPKDTGAKFDMRRKKHGINRNTSKPKIRGGGAVFTGGTEAFGEERGEEKMGKIFNSDDQPEIMVAKRGRDKFLKTLEKRVLLKNFQEQKGQDH